MAPLKEQSIKLSGRRYISKILIALEIIFSCGLCFVAIRNYLKAKIFLMTREEELSEAECVVVEDEQNNIGLYNVKCIKVRNTLGLKRYSKDGRVRILEVPYGRFIYDYYQNRFVLPRHVRPAARPFIEMLRQRVSMSRKEEEQEVYEKRVIFGDNVSDLSGKSIGTHILDMLVDVEFLYQMICICIWIAIEYKVYAYLSLALYIYFFIQELREKLQHEKELKAISKPRNIRVLRGGNFVELSDKDVLPGDFVYIDPCDSLACDAEVGLGTVVMDESFITGETIPVRKAQNGRVFAGTKVLRSNGSIQLSVSQGRTLLGVTTQAPSEPLDDVAIGIVLQTGSRTRHGCLIKSLLFRKKVKNCFELQSSRVMKWLVVITLGVVGFFIMFFLFKKLETKKIFELTFDLGITIFNPGLRTSVEIGTHHAWGSLSRQGIRVSDTTRINTTGEVDIAVFDKTGTLTEEGVEVTCVDTLTNQFEHPDDLANDQEAAIMRIALAACHSVVDLDGEYVGDPVDVCLFKFSKSKLTLANGIRSITIPGSNVRENVIKIINIEDFDPSTKRMSVVAEVPGIGEVMFCKGAPDVLESLFDPLPSDYRRSVDSHSLAGCRVISIGYKNLNASSSADLKGLTFLGLAVFTNRTKPESPSVIAELHNGGIKTRMCTGDGILTAISVARVCGILPKALPVLLPVTENGKSLEWLCIADEPHVIDTIRMLLYSEYDRSSPVEFAIACEGREFESLRGTRSHALILEKGIVFARFNPDNKKSLMEEYFNLGLTTLYCGDGANDTGALSAADVGLSLATNESNLAAPFIAKSVISTPVLIREGRSALVTSAAQFKHILFTQLIQGMQLSALFFFAILPSDLMSVVCDFSSVYVLSYALSKFKTSSEISPSRPTINLTRDARNIFIEVFVMFIIHLTTLIAYDYTNGIPSSKSFSTVSFPGTAFFFTLFFLLIYHTWLLADFGPFRQSRLNNKLFLALSSTCLIIWLSLLLCFYSGNEKVCKYMEFAKASNLSTSLPFIGCFGLSILITTFIS